MTAAEDASAPPSSSSHPPEPTASSNHSKAESSSPHSAFRPPSDLAFLVAAFTAFDVSFQQQQNDDTITAFASTCQQLCHRQQEREGREGREREAEDESPLGLSQCLRDCSLQILESFAHLEQRLEAQQAEIQQLTADELDDDGDDDDEEEVEDEEEEEEDEGEEEEQATEQEELQEDADEADVQS